MKRTERHHLKADPLAARLRTLIDGTRGGRWVTAAAGVAAAGLLAAGIVGWQQWRAARASDLLAAAMAIVDAPVAPADDAADTDDDDDAPAPDDGYPSVAAKLETAVPRLLDAADAYPRLPQGIAARYQAAAALAALGRTAEADDQYARVIELDGDGLYGRVARLGLAETKLQAGEYPAAVAVLDEAVAAADASLPADALIMRIGEAHQLAGDPEAAAAAFRRLLDEFPASGYRVDAERAIDVIEADR